MSNQFNAVKFFETFAKIIADREGVDITVEVRKKNDLNQALDTVGDVRHHKRYKLNKCPML